MKEYWSPEKTWVWMNGKWEEAWPAPIKKSWGIFYTGKLDWGWCLDINSRHQVFDNINEAHRELERWRGDTGEWQAYQVRERGPEGEVG